MAETDQAGTKSGGEPEGSAGSVIPRMGEVSGRVCRALEVVLEREGGSRARPTEVAETYGLNKSVASRMLKALRTADPVAALGTLPGTEALRGFVASAHSAGVPRASDAASAIDELEVFIRDEVGGRDSLAALLSHVLPDERRKYLLSNKQAVYRGMANIIGVSAEVATYTLIMRPSLAHGEEKLDVAWINHLAGVRQRRPECGLSQVHRIIGTTDSVVLPDGSPIESPLDFLVDDWTTIDRERVRLEQLEDGMVIDFDVGPMSVDHVFDIAMARMSLGSYPARAHKDGRSSGAGMDVDIPMKLGVIDVLMTPGVWEGRVPRVLTHKLGARGAVNPNDRLRRADVLLVDEDVERVDWGRLRIPEVSDYPGLVARVCEMAGIDAKSLTGFRTRAQYPLLGTQVSLDFPP